MAVEVSSLLHENYAAHKTDWHVVERVERWAKEFSDAISKLCGSDIELARSVRAKLQPFVTENRSLLKPENAVGAELLQYREAFRIFTAQLQRVQELGDCADALVHDRTAPGAITRLLGTIQNWQQAARQLQPWSLWQRVRGRAINNGLLGLVAALENGDVALRDVPEFFEYSYQSWWVKKAIDREPVLCTFSSADHERKISEFRNSDERFQKLTQQYIVAKLSGQIPANSAIIAGADSEMGKLRRELQKQRRHMPIRQLVQNLPTLMPKLKPCLLMSPLSVAQYLDTSHSQFDVVIFDEASQIPVWDAVGAIARGRQLICVGDPKQLPPTNFFNRSDDNEDGGSDDDTQDLESILDECIGIGMPILGLDWHYRSRHESLITFSNITYYKNRLITFPSPATEDRGVRFERIKGVYDRGGSRTNRAEAEAIVKAIEKHYLKPEGRALSLGVVTFNQAQQSLIERLLDERRRASSQLDQAIAQANEESLFIKNLENVQGDERDIIYFSITYGPDAAGKVNMNFGPLNTKGGQRRLNVAVSRARHEVVIFSTLLPEHIDLSRVRALGVCDLKNYLEFAIKGPRALVEQITPTGFEPDSPFEMEVITALRNQGWVVHPQVGVSEYRIDIGVVDRRVPGRYLLGVECDGRTYHSGATARDRDRLRQHVLENLGWELFRIWSTDWWLNPQEPLRKLLARLEELDAKELSEKEPSHQSETQEAQIEDEVPAIQSLAENNETEAVTKQVFSQFKITHLDQSGLKALHFYETSYSPTLRGQLLNVINTEGPIEESVLFKRIARAWSFSRTGNRIEERLRRLVPGSVVCTQDGSKKFYWPEGSDTTSCESFRVPSDDVESRRSIDEICLEELGNLALFILSEHGSTSREDLARTLCRLLGIARTTEGAEERIYVALKHGRVQNYVNTEDGWVMLSTKL